MWTVEKSNTRAYGYCLRWDGPEPKAWLKDGRHMGWYRRKTVAAGRADELNAAEAGNHCPWLG